MGIKGCLGTGRDWKRENKGPGSWEDGLEFIQNEESQGALELVQWRHPGQGRVGSTDLKTEMWHNGS